MGFDAAKVLHQTGSVQYLSSAGIQVLKSLKPLKPRDKDGWGPLTHVHVHVMVFIGLHLGILGDYNP